MQQTVAAAKADAEKAQADFQLALANVPNRISTNNDYVRIQAEMWTNFVRVQVNKIDLQYANLSSNMDMADLQSAMPEFASYRIRAEKEQLKLREEADLLEAKLEELKEIERAKETNKLETAQSRVTAAKARLESFPTGEDYLADFAPVLVQRTRTDADGKFSIVYPRNKAFAIFAKAQRAVLNRTEEYYWLVNAPIKGNPRK